MSNRKSVGRRERASPTTASVPPGRTSCRILEIERPVALADISRLPLAEIEELPGGGLRIGAHARNSAVAAHPPVRTHCGVSRSRCWPARRASYATKHRWAATFFNGQLSLLLRHGCGVQQRQSSPAASAQKPLSLGLIRRGEKAHV
jgi:hypothetical protein